MKFQKKDLFSWSHRQNHRLTLSLCLIFMFVATLDGCGDTLKEFNEKIAADAEARRGVYATLNTDLQSVIGIADSLTEIKLLRVDPAGNEEQVIMTLVGGLARGKPSKPDDLSVKFLYKIQIWYRTATSSTSDALLLLAEASKISKQWQVEFAADELHTAPYDRDGDGTIDATETASLNADNDDISNLAEIIEGGHPRNSVPTFLSPAQMSLVESSATGYIFYDAEAISAYYLNPSNSPSIDDERRPISYGLNIDSTDGRLANLLQIDSVTGALSTKSGQPLPAYQANGDNLYPIVLTATDTLAPNTANIGDITLLLTITDAFNMTLRTTTGALHFRWDVIPDPEARGIYYQLMQDIDGTESYALINTRDANNNPIPLKISDPEYIFGISVHLQPLKSETQYKVQARWVDNDNLIQTSSTLKLGDVLQWPQDISDGVIAYLKASNAAAGDFFGNWVSLSADGHTLAVGAMHVDKNSSTLDTGAVYVYLRQADNTWQQSAILNDSNAASRDSFGGSLSLSADGLSLAVGAYHADKTSLPLITTGSVYVYARQVDNTWQQTAILNNSNAATSDSFGISMSFSADGLSLAVGASRANKDSNTIGAGATYVYARQTDNTWQQQTILYASDAAAGDQFGFSVSLDADGHSLAVGAQQVDKDSSTRRTGAVYMYVRQTNNTWLQQTIFYASDAKANDEFGRSVSLSTDGRSLAVGAMYVDDKDSGNRNTGAVYLYTRQADNMWQQTILNASNAMDGDRFGNSVSLSADGQRLAVGAWGADKDSSTLRTTGAAYVYERQTDNTWLEKAALNALNAMAGDFFGTSVSLSADGRRLAVGIHRENGGGNGSINDCAKMVEGQQNCKINSGAVYVY